MCPPGYHAKAVLAGARFSREPGGEGDVLRECPLRGGGDFRACRYVLDIPTYLGCPRRFKMKREKERRGGGEERPVSPGLLPEGEARRDDTIRDDTSEQVSERAMQWRREAGSGGEKGGEPPLWKRWLRVRRR